MKANTEIWRRKQKERQKILNRTTAAQNPALANLRRRRILFAAAALGLLLPLAAFGVYSFQNYSREAALEFSGDTIFVRAGGDFQAALDRAKPGDTIFLQAGAAFKGSFRLPMKAGAEFITVRTSATDAQLPPAGTRLDPQKYAAVLPKLSSPTEDPVITAADGAHHFRFVGVEFGATRGGVGNIVKIGTGEEKKVEDLPHHIEFDRVYIHGSPTEGQRRGIAANGRFLKITNSHISDIKRRGDESQAIAVWATDGSIEITNNYLEAAAENILFGGAGSFLKLVPTDCLVRGNHLNKPLEWRAEGWDVKNLFEIKNGRRIRVENNLMTNNWGSAQDGTAILFSTRADNGRETVIEDIFFENNVVRGSGNAVNVYGAEGAGGRRLSIRNNFFLDIDGAKWNGAGIFMKATEWNGLAVENNTIVNSGNIASAYGAPIKGFVFRNNIVFENEYGFKGDDAASGNATIDRYFPRGEVTFNAIVGADAAIYRGRNLYPTSIRQLGFASAETGDYRLRSDSPLQGKGFGGKQIGADLDWRIIGTEPASAR